MNTDVQIDFIKNGVGHGSLASRLATPGFSINELRPYIAADGRPYMTKVNNGKAQALPLVYNNATLRSYDWELIDATVLKVALQRLTFVNSIVSAGLVYRLDGMSKTLLETERQSDINDAHMSMSAEVKGQNDRPEYDRISLPLPIIHKDFSFDGRQLAVSRNSNTPLDMTMVEASTRKVAEMAERLALGIAPTYKFAGAPVYGLTNFPERLTYTITSPTASGWTPKTLVQEIAAMRQMANKNKFYGPFNLYVSSEWDEFLDQDYNEISGVTLRERVAKLNNIGNIVTVDYLTGYQICMVQMTSDVIRQVIGLDITTVQWEGPGGFSSNFKVLGILVPQLRADFEGNCGIVHANI